LSENRTRLALVALVAVAHAAAILFLPAFGARADVRQARETVAALRLADIAEIPPVPPAPEAAPAPEAVQAPEAAPALQAAARDAPSPAVAETATAAEAAPDPPPAESSSPGQSAEAHVSAGAIAGAVAGPEDDPWGDFLPIRQVTEPPRFDGRAIAADLAFPPVALRSSIEGRVILELFVDRNGVVRLAQILREEPEGMGFGEAARRAFLGRQGEPATADGIPVAARFRYPVSFRIR